MPREAPAWIVPTNYHAICRHYQFCDIHNGMWYVEMLGLANGKVVTLSIEDGGPVPTEFIVQEVRDGKVVKRSHFPKPFAEARKVYWNRTHTMSLEAGLESIPVPELMKKIIWE